MIDFEQLINRKDSGCVKWDNVTMRCDNENALPMWVADSDYACAKEIVSVIKKRADHPIYGYSYVDDKFKDVTANYIRRMYNFNIEPNWVIYSPGIVPFISMAVQKFTNEGDNVLINRPVYHPFTNVVVEANRNVVSSSLVNNEGRYELDFEDFETKAKNPKTKIFILCNPHNPVGKVWNEKELKIIGDICVRNNVLIISDEIHSDIIVNEDVKHIPIASLSEEILNITCTCYSPSKTYNIAGLGVSGIVIPNKDTRKIMDDYINCLHIQVPNVFAMPAYETAYTECDYYKNEQNIFLKENFAYLREQLKQINSKIVCCEEDATYFAWLDCRKLFDDYTKVTPFFQFDCAIAINPGELFGIEGLGYVRMNIACPKSIIKEAIRRIKIASEKL